MANHLKFGKEAREALRAGAEKVYKAVSSTLGARGRNVVRQNFGRPKITNDGVSIARAIDLEDEFEKQGADLLKEAAEKTVKEAGDGTTTATVLAYSTYEEGLKLIDNGHNAMVLRTYIEEEIVKVQDELKKLSTPITTDEELDNIATISVQSPEYGKIIADAIRIAGKDGLVLAEEDYATFGIKKEEISGYRFDRGLESPFLVTNQDKMECVFDGKDGSPIHVLVADKQWNLVGDLMPLFAELKKNGADKILIIAEEISGELMSFININRIKLTFHAAVVKCPFDKNMLEDIATLTGAKAVTNAKGIAKPKMEHLGTAKKIIVTQDNTTIIGGAGTIDELVVSLRQQISDADEGYEKQKLQERLAKLTGKTVMLKVGAATEAEARYLKDKLDDAIGATKAAVEEGVVAGGGMALYRIGEELYGDDSSEMGLFMKRVLRSPVDKILENCGVEDRAQIYQLLSLGETSGYDALKGEVVKNIIDSGIIDPSKVTRCAVKNSLSLAAMLLTTDTVIAEIPEKIK